MLGSILNLESIIPPSLGDRGLESIRSTQQINLDATVGWVKQARANQQKLMDVGFRTLTQPTSTFYTNSP